MILLLIKMDFIIKKPISKLRFQYQKFWTIAIHKKGTLNREFMMRWEVKMVRGVGVRTGSTAEQRWSCLQNAHMLIRYSTKEKRRQTGMYDTSLCLCQRDAHAWMLMCLTGRHQHGRTIQLSPGSCFLLAVLYPVSISIQKITPYAAVKKTCNMNKTAAARGMLPCTLLHFQTTSEGQLAH